jgi:hypothetical protein
MIDVEADRGEDLGPVVIIPVEFSRGVEAKKIVIV